MSEILTIANLSKTYGKLQAVNNLNLTIKKGEVFGILGPNGSGKSTTLGMILEVVAPTSGTYQWFGGMPNVEARQKVGAILESPCFYSYLSAVQNLRIIAHIKKCGTDRIEPILKKVNLYDRRNDKFKTYSLGMKQRLSIAAALLADPPVLLLDEPTNGLDPQGIAEIRELIRSIAAEGKTIIMASHLLDEVQKVCTHFCILRKGVKLHEGAVSAILGDTNIVEIAANDMKHLESRLAHFEGLEKVVRENGSLHVYLKENSNSQHLNQYCFDNQVVLQKLIPQSKSLEQEFLKILKEND